MVPSYFLYGAIDTSHKREVIPIKTPVSRVGNKTAILHILYALFPLKYGRFIDVFGGSGSVLLGKPEVTPFEVYNDFDRNLVNLFHCMKERTLAVIRELGFCHLNSREDFIALRRFFDHEVFSDEYLSEELKLTAEMLPEAESVKNAVIQEAMNILADRTPVEETMEEPLPELPPEPTSGEVDELVYDPLPVKEKRASMWKLYRQAKEYLDRDSEDYDPEKAVDLLMEAAEQGCDIAKYRLGKMFLRGEYVPQNVDYALRWLEDAVADGNQYAEYLLGKTLLIGEDAEQDLPRAENLLKRSADQGNRYAKYTLGKAYLDGQLLLQDIPEAIRLLTESADSGFAPAQYLLGKLLYQGEVISQDLERAISYLEGAASQNNPYAAYLAGKLLLTEEAVKDVLRAIKNLEIAAENGNHFAEYQLGKLYLYGREVDRDYDKAMEYLTAAAEYGNQYATQLLHSVKSNRNWSAAMGSIRLLHHLARMLQNQLEDEHKEKTGAIDRKLKRKIDEKKQAHGLRQG